MKVLHFYKTSFPDTIGGVEQVISEIARGSARYGIETNILSLTDQDIPSILEIDGYQINRAKMNFQIASTGFSFSAFSRFKELATAADLVHYHFPWPFMDIVHFVTRVKKPTLVTYHSDIIRQKTLLRLYEPLQARFLRSVDKIIATSPNYLRTSQVLQGFTEKTEVIPIGIDRASYPKSSLETKAKWTALIGPKFYLFIGVLRYYKGLHVLLDAAVGTNFPIVIVGAGPTETELKRQAIALGLKHIHFLGHVSDVDKVALLDLSFAVVFPSHLRSEAFGVSLLEGAMFGKPLISSEIGTGTSYINVHEKTGLLVRPSDSESLRNAMRYLWENPKLASEMGRQAGFRYGELFTADLMVDSYIRSYVSLTSDSPLGKTSKSTFVRGLS